MPIVVGTSPTLHNLNNKPLHKIFFQLHQLNSGLYYPTLTEITAAGVPLDYAGARISQDSSRSQLGPFFGYFPNLLGQPSSCPEPPFQKITGNLLNSGRKRRLRINRIFRDESLELSS